MYTHELIDFIMHHWYKSMIMPGLGSAEVAIQIYWVNNPKYKQLAVWTFDCGGEKVSTTEQKFNPGQLQFEMKFYDLSNMYVNKWVSKIIHILKVSLGPQDLLRGEVGNFTIHALS